MSLDRLSLTFLLLVACIFGIASVNAAPVNYELAGAVARAEPSALRQRSLQDLLAGQEERCSFSCPTSYAFEGLLWMAGWVDEGTPADEGQYACFYSSSKAR
jgi:hypothetical protein